jgi:hypothetical protein
MNYARKLFVSFFNDIIHRIRVYIFIIVTTVSMKRLVKIHSVYTELIFVVQYS